MLEIHGGWRVCDEAEDGKQAIETFRKTRPDLVVLDFQMPAMNGLEAAGIMRRLSPDTPILIVTLYPSRQLTEEAKNLGVKGACAKADLRTVADAVNALLRRETYFQL
jgi:two-component system chemotaxis response regulator CheY